MENSQNIPIQVAQHYLKMNCQQCEIWKTKKFHSCKYELKMFQITRKESRGEFSRNSISIMSKWADLLKQKAIFYVE